MRKFELRSKIRAIWKEKVTSLLDKFVQFGKIMETAKLLGTCSFDLGRKKNWGSFWGTMMNLGLIMFRLNFVFISVIFENRWHLKSLKFYTCH